jgi:hypothetical protein
MSCLYCESKTAHVCLPFTCPNCFSEKDLNQRLCYPCTTALPCFFCTSPSKYKHQGLNLCPEHIAMAEKSEREIKKEDEYHRLQKLKVYEKVCKSQRNQRDHSLKRILLANRKSGAPKLSELQKRLKKQHVRLMECLQLVDEIDELE